jgi:hypothetical protein
MNEMKFGRFAPASPLLARHGKSGGAAGAAAHEAHPLHKIEARDRPQPRASFRISRP